MNCRRAFLALTIFLATSCGGGSNKPQPSALQDIRSIQAEQTAAISEIRSELRRISGEIEEIQHSSAGRTKELEETLQQFSSRVPPPEGVSEELLVDDEDRLRGNDSDAARLYIRGAQMMRAGNFQGATKVFKEFVDLNPDTAFSDNALFWIGVAYDKLGQYDRAIVAYSDVFTLYPAEDRVDVALLNLAESFIKIGAAEDARVTFQKLIADHPRSKYAKQAKSRLVEIRKLKSRRG